MNAAWATPDGLARQQKPQSEAELRLRARSLVGAHISDIAHALQWPLPHNEKNAKGYIGQLIEAALGSDIDAHDRPDFVALGIECKTVPLTCNADGRWHPKESTFVCSINIRDAHNAQWDTSRVKTRLNTVLWVGIESAQCALLARRKVSLAKVVRPNDHQWQRLRADWEDLMGAIGAGRGHSLGAQEGEVLQVRPKAATSHARSLGVREDGPGQMLPLGFYLRARFVEELLFAR